MIFRNLILLTFTFIIVLTSCSKDKFDAEKQAQIDDATIQEFITDNNIPAQKHETGIYYQILAEGEGDLVYSPNTTVSAHYVGRFLNGTEFDRSRSEPAEFTLGGVILGWQVGVPLIQKGGRIRLIIPSAYAYGPEGDFSGTIPGNTVLDFEIELADVTNN